jgi:hypothetical protein
MAQAEVVRKFLEDARGATAEGAGYRPLPAKPDGEDMRGAYVCSASECRTMEDMRQREGVKEGIPIQMGGVRRRKARRTRRRRSLRRRFTVNARIRIRLPRH